METPVQIVFHEVTHSAALQDLVREKAAKLCNVFPRLTRCHVSIEQPHRHQSQGRLFSVRIVLHVPNDELIASQGEHEDVHVALRDAFDAARRQIEDYAHKLRSKKLRKPAGEPPAAEPAEGQS
jgi:ribosomal subunit interface protein